jgi:hypothetical protein
VPADAEGAAALALLRQAFQGGHVFVVGGSVTTGQRDTVVWASVHHKTRLDGGAARHGYPDASYGERLRSECAAHGIFTAEMQGEMDRERERERERERGEEGAGDRERDGGDGGVGKRGREGGGADEQQQEPGAGAGAGTARKRLRSGTNKHRLRRNTATHALA